MFPTRVKESALDQASCVYHFTCPIVTCQATYIGHTTCKVKRRAQQHRYKLSSIFSPFSLESETSVPPMVNFLQIFKVLATLETASILSFKG